jgi:hypothetical protein
VNNLINPEKEIFDKAARMLCREEGVTFINYLRDDTGRWAVRCNTCGQIQVYPLPGIDEDVNYYKNNYEQNKEYLELELPEGLECVNQYYKDVMEKDLKSYAIMGVAALP